MAQLASSIPDSLRWGCSQSTIRTNRYRLVPQGSQSAGQNGTIRVRLPERSLVRLSSLSAYFNFNLSGISTNATDYNNALIPASYKPFRSVRFLVNGQSASGHLAQNYDVIYEALVQSSTDDRWALSRLAQGYKELVGFSDDSSTGVTLATTTSNVLFLGAAGTSTTKTQYMYAEDFLGLPRINGKGGQNGGVIDTSLFGVVEVEFILNDNSILTTWGATANAVAACQNITWSMDNFRCEIDVISSVSPAYVELMAMKLSDPAPIKCAFQNYVQTISTATGNNRLQVNSSCVDMIMVLPMAYNWNTLVPITPSSALGTPAGAFGLLTSGAIYPVQPVHYQFNSALDLTNEDTCRLQILVGSETYPKTIISHALDVFDINTNSFFHGSTSNKNMFYYGVQATAAGGVQNVVYSRALALASSCIHAQAFSLQSEGWSSSVLTGLDTASQNVDIIVQSQNFPAPSGANAGVQMLVALTTSQLVYDPQTASVSVIP
jgi:hypothetical protein